MDQVSAQAESAKQIEERVTSIIANSKGTIVQFQAPITGHVTISATGAAETTAPLTPVVQPQIEAEQKD